MSSPDSDTLLLVGVVLRAHGLQGELKVLPETDVPERFERLKRVFLGPSPEAALEHDVATVRFQYTKRGAVVLLGLVSVTTREEAEALRRAGVYVPEAELPPLADDEVFIHDLPGLAVTTEDGAHVGRIKDVLDLPAHPLLVVERATGSDVMIPAVPAFVASIDVAEKNVVVRVIEGLLD